VQALPRLAKRQVQRRKIKEKPEEKGKSLDGGTTEKLLVWRDAKTNSAYK